MKISQLAIELDHLVDLEAHQVAMAQTYYGDTYTKDEYSALPLVVPDFFRDAPPRPGVLGSIRRLHELEPRLFVHVITDRSDSYRMEFSDWCQKWLGGWSMPPFTLGVTSDFRLVPAQLYVVAERHDTQLHGLKTVRTVAELLSGSQDTLDFDQITGDPATQRVTSPDGPINAQQS